MLGNPIDDGAGALIGALESNSTLKTLLGICEETTELDASSWYGNGKIQGRIEYLQLLSV